MKKYLIVTLVTLLLIALSWATTAGIIWLICLCFKWSFNLLIATGWWLIGFLWFGCFKSSE